MSMNAKNKETKKVKRKPYKRPKLVRYGSLKELTKFGGSMSADFFGMQT
jgi:hypothetical protein